MRFNPVLLAGSVLALATVAPANAVVITGLHNTGVDGDNVIATGVGIADQHWTLDDGVAYVSGQNGIFPLAGHWIPEDLTSRWLTPTPVAGATLDPVVNGLYTYSLDFSLAGFLPDSARFAGRFATDNDVAEIMLNGHRLASSGGGYRHWTDFSADTGFVAGLNTLSFVVTNIGQKVGNPSGLRVEFGTSDAIAAAAMPTAGAVPEPASWAMMIGGFGLVGAAMRRRERAVAA